MASPGGGLATWRALRAHAVRNLTMCVPASALVIFVFLAKSVAAETSVEASLDAQSLGFSLLPAGRHLVFEEPNAQYAG